MGRRALLAVLALASACSAPRPWGEGVNLTTLFSGGYRAVNHETLDEHEAYGLELATRDTENGWGYELGGSYATEEVGGAGDPEIELDEFYLGLRRSWEFEGYATKPYVGVGGAYTRTETTFHDPHDETEDTGGAAYVHGGVLWHLGRLPFDRGLEVLIGVDARGVFGPDYDYSQMALVLGFGR